MAAVAWFGAIVFGLLAYVSLDGYDLGMGILAILLPDGERRALVELVAPVWDGNESWILLIGVGLWAGFPAAYGAFLPSVYLALILMIFALIARGVSVEMVSVSGRWPRGWGRAFMGGSLVAAFAQGMVFGALVQGVRLGPDQRFTGSTFGFFSGYTILTGLTAVVLYALAGAAMVKMRAQDPALVASVSRQGRYLVPVLVLFVALCGSLLPVAGAASLTIGQPVRVAVIVWTCAIAVTMLATAWWSFGRSNHRNLAFGAVLSTVAAGLAGLLALDYPMIVPPALSLSGAASPASSLEFLLGGFGLFIPLILSYNLYAFWVLRPRPGAPAPPPPLPADVQALG